MSALLGLIVLAIALQLSKTGDLIERDVAIARAAGQPKAVALARFDPAQDMTVSGEVNLVVRLDPKHMLSIVASEPVEGGGSRTYVRRLFLLQDAGDKSSSKTARGAVLLADDDVGKFLGLVDDTHSKTTRGGQVVGLNGIAVTEPLLGQAVMAEIDRQGMKPAKGFVFVRPFLDGRETAFQPRDRSWRILVGIVAAIGASLLMLAIGKRVMIIRAAQS